MKLQRIQSEIKKKSNKTRINMKHCVDNQMKIRVKFK